MAEGDDILGAKPDNPQKAELGRLAAAVNLDVQTKPRLGELAPAFIEACDTHLLTMDLEDDRKVKFSFPYIKDIETGVIGYAEGLMESEKITIGGHAYAIKAPWPITLSRVAFPGGYLGEAKLTGTAGVSVESTINTRALYVFLNELRGGLREGTVKNLILTAPVRGVTFTVEFTAL